MSIEISRAEAYAHCARIVRELDYDRWLASLAAPAQARPHILALHAFSAEVARIGAVITQPQLGEIRLQWWRDAVAGEREEAQAHPVIAALAATMDRFRMPVAPLIALVDARSFDFWSDPPPDLNWLEGYCGETSSSLIRLATLTLADGGDAGPAEAAGHAGVAWAMTGLLRAVPWHAAASKIFIPKEVFAARGAEIADYYARRPTPALRAALADLRESARGHLLRARESLRSAPPSVRPAFAMLALVEPYLRRMERRDYDPFRTTIDLPSWTKAARVWTRRALR